MSRSQTTSQTQDNSVYAGGRVAITNPPNASDQAQNGIMVDKAGRIVTTTSHVRDLVGVQTTAVTTTSETTFITAGGAGVFLDITQLIITTVDIVVGTLTIKDSTGGTVRMIVDYPNAASAPAAPLIIPFNPPLPQSSANNNWTIQASANATHYEVTATFIKNT